MGGLVIHLGGLVICLGGLADCLGKLFKLVWANNRKLFGQVMENYLGQLSSNKVGDCMFQEKIRSIQIRLD